MTPSRISQGWRPDRIRYASADRGAGARHRNGERLHRTRQREAMRELGYIESKNLLIEYRYGDGKIERFPEIAMELVRLKLDVILAASTSMKWRGYTNHQKKGLSWGGRRLLLWIPISGACSTRLVLRPSDRPGCQALLARRY